MESTGRKLLLADDSLTIQKVVKLTFTDEGMEVFTVGTGEEAMRFLEESGAPDVVLADVHMPGMSGYEVCERIKQDERWRHVPVILLAGAFEPFNEAEARRVGADEVLTKPFQSIKGLIGKVGSLFGGKSAEEPPRDADERRPGAHEQHSHAADAHASARAAAPQAAEAYGAEAPTAPPARAQADSFTDFGMDDEMIEATPAESFGQTAAPASAAGAEAHGVHVQTDGARADDDSATPAYAERREEVAYAERREEPAYASARGDVAADYHAAAPAARSSFAARSAAAADADESLLDLGLDAPPAAAVAAVDDDFVLDLDLDEPPLTPMRPAYEASSASATHHAESTSASPAESEPAAHGESVYAAASGEYAAAHGESDYAAHGRGESASHVDAAGAFAEAAHGAAEAREESAAPAYGDFASDTAAPEDAAAPRHFVEPQVVASDEPVRMDEDLSVEGDIARPPVAATAWDFSDAAVAHEHGRAPSETHDAAREASAVAAASSSSATPEQLSPEVIDAIARRAVELLSERVVQDIAWEVVPELAERIIRQRLDQQK